MATDEPSTPTALRGDLAPECRTLTQVEVSPRTSTAPDDPTGSGAPTGAPSGTGGAGGLAFTGGDLGSSLAVGSARDRTRLAARTRVDVPPQDRDRGAWADLNQVRLR